jgi:hypothetical protein
MCLFLIIGLIVAIAIFANVLWLREKSHDGKIIITQEPDGRKLFSLEIDKTPLEIENMKTITFKVVQSEDFVN